MRNLLANLSDLPPCSVLSQPLAQALPKLHRPEPQDVAAVLLGDEGQILLPQAAGDGRLLKVAGGSGTQGWEHHAPPVFPGSLPDDHPQSQILPGG